MDFKPESASYFSLVGRVIQSLYAQELPADPSQENCERQVEHAAYTSIDVVKGSPAENPELISFSGLCAQDCFGMDGKVRPDGTGMPDEDTLKILSGLIQIVGTQPFAMCYGGYQFGVWMGQMGDGRQINLGTIINPKTKESWELQLKGGGKTPYARKQDGQAAVRSSIREYLCCQAMHALGVPTPRALSLISTGRTLKRDLYYDGNITTDPGAIVCRVATSYIRFGHFELAYKRGDLDLLRQLADFVLKHHYQQEVKEECGNKYLILLQQVVKRTAYLVAKWQGLGFVHGVMNTDNMSIVGITLDYGPFGFLNKFDPNYTPNTYDKKSRYTFKYQPVMAVWALNSLAETLSPLIERAHEAVQKEEVEEKFMGLYQEFYHQEMRRKFGFKQWNKEIDSALLQELFDLMEESEADYTNTFRNLAKVVQTGKMEVLRLSELSEGQKERWEGWIQKYSARLIKEKESQSLEETVRLMLKSNPKYILRNYLAQEAIEKAEQGDKGAQTNRLLGVLRNPFEEQEQMNEYAQDAPSSSYKKGVYLTSCQT